MAEPNSLCYGCFLAPGTSQRCPRCGYKERIKYPSALRPGVLLAGKYLVGRVLGKPGGFGITYLAHDQVDGDRRAIKELMPRDLVHRDGSDLLPQGPDSAELFTYTRKRFFDEGRMLGSFDPHPNIVEILDCFQQNGTVYLVMPYYDGLSLAERLRGGERISAAESIEIMTPILVALEIVHGKGILHRDISPDNIYLAGRSRPILIDFGASRHALGVRSRDPTTIVKPGYSPHEQYASGGNQGEWTDVYACAATLYRMLTGERPPEAPARVTADPLVPPRKLNPEIDEHLDQAIVKGLAFHPQDRFDSAGALRRAIAISETSAPTSPFPLEDGNPTTPEDATRQIQKIKAETRAETWWNAAGLGLVIVVGLVVTIFVAVNASRAADEARLDAARLRDSVETLSDSLRSLGAGAGPEASLRADLAAARERAGTAEDERDQESAAREEAEDRLALVEGRLALAERGLAAVRGSLRAERGGNASADRAANNPWRAYSGRLGSAVIAGAQGLGYRPGRTLVEDDFADNSNAWPQRNDPGGRYLQVTGGRYVMEQRTEGASLWTGKSLQHGNLLARYTVRYMSGRTNNGMGLFFRWDRPSGTTEGTQYHFLLDAAGTCHYMLGSFDLVSEAYDDLKAWQTTSLCRADANNVVEILVVGNRVTIFLNNRRLDEVAGIRNATGNYVGFRVPGQMRYAVDDLLIVSLAR